MRFRCGGLFNDRYYKCTVEFTGERILKLGDYLAKLQVSKANCLTCSVHLLAALFKDKELAIDLNMTVIIRQNWQNVLDRGSRSDRRRYRVTTPYAHTTFDLDL